MSTNIDARLIYMVNRTEELLHDDPISLIVASGHRGISAMRDLIDAKTADETVFARNRMASVCRVEATEIALHEWDGDR